MKLLIMLLVPLLIVGVFLFVFKSKWIDKLLSPKKSADEILGDILGAKENLNKNEADIQDSAKSLMKELDKTREVKKSISVN